MKGTLMGTVTVGLLYDIRETLRQHGIEPDTATLLAALEQVVASGASPVAT